MPEHAAWVVASWAIIFGSIVAYGVAQLSRQKRLQRDLERERKK